MKRGVKDNTWRANRVGRVRKFVDEWAKGG